MASSVVLPFYGLSSTFFPTLFSPRPFSVFPAFSMPYDRNPLSPNGFRPSLSTGKPHYLPLYAVGVPLLEISLGAIPRGFESHPLRQKAIRFCEWLFSCHFAEKQRFSRQKVSKFDPLIFVFFLFFFLSFPYFFMEFSPSSTLSLLPAENFFPWHAPK